jgi:hypothetical protein
MEKAAYGSDLPSVQIELESHLKEHKSVDKFQSNVEKCISNKVKRRIKRLHSSNILK